MKINYGKFKNRNLIIGNNDKMRPTKSMTKSIIFNILNINKNDYVVDLFAGTGALGFESASLGASKVVWSDNNKKSIIAINENIKILKLNDNYKALNIDFKKLLKLLDFKPTIIFLDPPYSVELYFDEALKIIVNENVMSENGIIILEKPYKMNIPSLSKYIIIDNRKIGKSDLLFLKINYEKN